MYSEDIKQRLIFNSLFVMAYEQFINGWESTLYTFYADSAKNKNGQIEWTFSTKDKELLFKNNVLRSYKNSHNKAIKGLSICKTLLNMHMIDIDDFEILKAVHSKRNKYVHEFPLMSQKIPDEDRNLFANFLEVRSKACRNWIIEVEIPTNTAEANAVFLDKDGNFIPPEDAFDFSDIYFRAISDIALQN